MGEPCERRGTFCLRCGYRACMAKSQSKATRSADGQQKMIQDLQAELERVKGERVQVAKQWRALLDAALPPSPMCRDCADAFGRCPNRDRPCDPTAEAVEVIGELKAAEARLASLRSEVVGVLEPAIETLAASRHLIGKYVPEHHWLPEHDRRIADLRALRAKLSDTFLMGEEKGSGDRPELPCGSSKHSPTTTETSGKGD